MRKDYATELTKEDLRRMGVTYIDESIPQVFGVYGPFNYFINKQGYFMVNLYDIDEEGNRIKCYKRYKYIKKDGTISYYDSYYYLNRPITLNRVMWAWHYGKVREGYVIDHIKNKHDELKDYLIDKLEEITPGENISKERLNSNTKILKAGKKKDIKYYEDKLNYYTDLYIKAKKEHNAHEAHKARSNMSNQKAKIRYLIKEKENNDRHVEEIKLY